MKKRIGVELRKLHNLMAREVSKKARDLPDDGKITDMHVNIMDYLLEAGEAGVMQKELEEVFTVRKSTASRTLKLMEKNGMIERHGVDYDARLKRIVLTESARQHHNQMRAEADKLERRVREGISETELETFFDVLEKMKKNLKQ